MKKLDKLILKSFIGPFIITFLVAVFILLLVYMMKYFDDFIGKNIGIATLGELMGYFSINQMPMALPLAVLISSLMTYGKLGEHFELTAIKGSGISLLRIILPAFVFCVSLAIGAFVLNDQVVPKANLRAFSLLYDIKQTKPALDLREGQFYNGIPKYSIKIDKKYPDGISIKNIIIYDHTDGNGNKKVIIADSCRMYSFMGDRYLKMDLFNGNYYFEEEKKSKRRKKDEVVQFVRTKFANMDLVFSLASFDLNDTDESLFADNRYMKGIQELTESIDSMDHSMINSKFKIFGTVAGSYKFHLGGYLEPPSDLINRKDYLDSLKELKKLMKPDSVLEILDDDLIPNTNDNQVAKNEMDSDSIKVYKPKVRKNIDVSEQLNDGTKGISNKSLVRKKEKKQKYDSLIITNDSLVAIVKYKMDSIYQKVSVKEQILSRAVGNARNIKSSLNSSVLRMKGLSVSYDSHVVEKYKKFAQAFSCIVMFLIGAPLGAIIKRGGLGFPVIISIFFFIIFYVLTSVGDKWAKSGVVDGFYAAWMANFVLFPIGVFFLKQARKDAKLFDADFYSVWIENAKNWWQSRMKKKQTT